MKIYNQNDEYQNYPEVSPLQVFYFDQAPDGDVEPWSTAPIGSLHFNTTAGSVGMYQKTVDNNADADWRQVYTSTTRTGWIDLNIGDWREVASNDIINTAGDAGVLATDTTPAYQFVNGDTDSAHELRWAAANVDPITRQFLVPRDYDEAGNWSFKVLAKMGGAADTPVLSLDTFFDLGDTKLEDDVPAITGTTLAVYTATIAAADIPASAYTCSIELTPAAHGTDALVVMAIWIEYTKL
jgi:hypothetical protein